MEERTEEHVVLELQIDHNELIETMPILKLNLLKATIIPKMKGKVSLLLVLIRQIAPLEQFQALKQAEQMVNYEILRDLFLQDFQQVLEMQLGQLLIITQKLED